MPLTSTEVPGKIADWHLPRPPRPPAHDADAATLAADYHEAHRALAKWVAQQLDALRGLGKKVVLTVHVDGSKVTVKVDPPPEAVEAKT